MNKTLLGLCALILVSAGIYALYATDPAFQRAQKPSYAAESSNGGVQPDAGTASSKHAVTWKFESQGEDPEIHAERTKVILTWDGVSHDVGTYQGTCAEIDGSTGSLSENEVSGVLCWFAGAGDEIGVFNENGTYVVKHGEQQEPAGEGGGFRGNFKTLISL